MFRVPFSNRARPWLLLWLVPWLVMGTLANAPHDHDYHLHSSTNVSSTNAPALNASSTKDVSSTNAPDAHHDECALCEWLAVASSVALVVAPFFVRVCSTFFVAFSACVHRAGRRVVGCARGRGPPTVEVVSHALCV